MRSRTCPRKHRATVHSVTLPPWPPPFRLRASRTPSLTDSIPKKTTALFRHWFLPHRTSFDYMSYEYEVTERNSDAISLTTSRSWARYRSKRGRTVRAWRRGRSRAWCRSNSGNREIHCLDHSTSAEGCKQHRKVRVDNCRPP